MLVMREIHNTALLSSNAIDNAHTPAESGTLVCRVTDHTGAIPLTRLVFLAIPVLYTQLSEHAAL